jgi:hypothetical protein
MQNSIQKEKKPPVIKTIALIAAGLTVALVMTITEVTENVTVLAITEHGCVGESELGVSVVVPECTSQVGEVVSATFFVPAMEKNGYYDRIESKLAMVEP